MKKIIIFLIIFGLFFILFPMSNVLADDNPLVSDVVAYWAFDNVSGNIAIDSTSNQNNGTLINMETIDWVTGKVNNCLNFDGVNEYIDCGNIANFERTDSFSIEGWFKTSGNGVLVAKYELSTFRGWSIYLVDGKIYYYLGYGSGNRVIVETIDTYNNNTWNHFIATYDGSSDANNVEIYINSVSVLVNIYENTLTNTIHNTKNCQIASRDGVSMPFLGSIDEVVIYSKELTQSEVDFRYNNGVGRKYSLGEIPNKPICISPPDKKLNIEIDTTLKTKVIDIDSFTMNVSFYFDNVLFENFSNVANNTILESSNLSLDYSTMYNWYVIVEDEYYTVTSDTFIFATISEPEPIIPNISPMKPILISPDNNSINVSKFTRLKTHVDDLDDDFLFVRFYWENNSEIQSLFSITNYTIQTSTLNLEYNTSYSWYVIATDFIDYNLSDIYTFTTESEPVEDEDEDNISPPTAIELDYTILLIGICLAVIVFVLEFYSNRLKIKRSNLLSAIELALLLIIISIMIFLKVS